MPEQPQHSKERPEDSKACSTTEFHEVKTSWLPSDDPVFVERQRIARERFEKRQADQQAQDKSE